MWDSEHLKNAMQNGKVVLTKRQFHQKDGYFYIEII